MLKQQIVLKNLKVTDNGGILPLTILPIIEEDLIQIMSTLPNKLTTGDDLLSSFLVRNCRFVFTYRLPKTLPSAYRFELVAFLPHESVPKFVLYSKRISQCFLRTIDPSSYYPTLRGSMKNIFIHPFTTVCGHDFLQTSMV